jgi:hypothetical protein
MLAQVSLIPAESKKLIAKAVARMEPVQSAIRDGIIVLHPSSSTYFVVEEITGQRPPSNFWVAGAIVPKGACGDVGLAMGRDSVFVNPPKLDPRTGKPSPGGFPNSWVLRKGQWSKKEPLGDLLDQMGPRDVYIKGVNAVDKDGNAGVLWANDMVGGTAGYVSKARRRNGFQMVFPVGLEKLIPGTVGAAAKAARKFEYDYAMGASCGLLPVKGHVVTEPKAIEVLTGAKATVISAGGLGGAEGAVTMVIKGETDQVTKAIEYVESSKGAQLPQIRVANCHDCPNPPGICKFRLGGKPWVIW